MLIKKIQQMKNVLKKSKSTDATSESKSKGGISLPKRIVCGALTTIMLVTALPITAYAYPMTSGTQIGQQIKIQNGGRYDGSDGTRYNSDFTVNAANGVQVYFERGNSGAGGSINGLTTINIKSISTTNQNMGGTKTWVPLYRISRSGGYSDDVANADAIAYTHDAEQIAKVANGFGMSRKILSTEADMIKSVLENGLKQFQDLPWGAITFEDNMKYFATQIIVWEIQEGKRHSLIPTHYRQEADTIGNNPYYWRDLYNHYRTFNPNIPDYYTQILQRCSTGAGDLTVQTDRTFLNATQVQVAAPTDTIQYNESTGLYTKTFTLNDNWGSDIGQFAMNDVAFLPTNGNNDFYITKNGNDVSVNSKQKLQGIIRLKQNCDTGGYNDIGIMGGTSKGKMKGYLYGGNGEQRYYYFKVVSEGGPKIVENIDVKFVDWETGKPVKVDWGFGCFVSGNQFVENSTGKSFVPKYFTDNKVNANYQINVASVPENYLLPKNQNTMFSYNYNVTKWGADGGCDYDSAGATFDGSSITIKIKRKKPVTVKFVDASTQETVNVDWSFKVAGIDGEKGTEFTENSSEKTFVPKYFLENNQANANYSVQLDSVPNEYLMPGNQTTFFNYYDGIVLKFGSGGTGWGECDYNASGATFDGNTITISLKKTEYVEVEFVDMANGKTIDVDWKSESVDRLWGDTFTNQGKVNFIPSYWNDNHESTDYNIQILDSKGYFLPTENAMFSYDGKNVSKVNGCDYTNAQAEISNKKITIKLVKKNLPVNVKFVDKTDKKTPVSVTGFVTAQKTGIVDFSGFSHTFAPSNIGDNLISLTGVDKDHIFTPNSGLNMVYTFNYENGLPKYSANNKLKDDVIIDGDTITILVERKADVFYDTLPIEIVYRDRDTSEALATDWSFKSTFTKDLMGHDSNVKIESSPSSFIKIGERNFTADFTLKTNVPEGYKPIDDINLYYTGRGIYDGNGDYGYDNATQDVHCYANTIFIYLHKLPTEMTVEFVDSETKEPVVVDWDCVSTGTGEQEGLSFTESSQSSSKSFIPKAGELCGGTIEIKKMPTGYAKPMLPAYFFYLGNTGVFSPNVFGGSSYDESVAQATYDGFTLTVSLNKIKPMTVKVVDKDTGELVRGATWEVFAHTAVELYYGENLVMEQTESSVAYSDSVKDVFKSGEETFVPKFYRENGSVFFGTLKINNLPASYFYPQGNVEIGYEGNMGVLDNMSQGSWDEIQQAWEKAQAEFDETTGTFTIFVVRDKTVPPVVEDDIQVEFVLPNSDYHYTEEVISSFYVKNLGTKNYNPNTGTLDLKMTIEKQNASEWGEFYTETKSGVIVPANGTQVAYLKWSVPDLKLTTGREKYRIVSTVLQGGRAISTSTSDVTIASFDLSSTPRPKFDIDGGKYFVPLSPLVKNQDYHNSASWQEYEWENGEYVVKTYTNKLWTQSITVYPDETNPTAEFNSTTKKYTSRSGYALKLKLLPKTEQFEQLNGTLVPIVNKAQTTAVQRATAHFPENRYSSELEKYQTLDILETNVFSLRVFADSTYAPGEKGDTRKHFVPMWYPDGDYVIQCVASACWTPAGMLDYTDESNVVTISGSMYDDWYSSGNDK